MCERSNLADYVRVFGVDFGRRQVVTALDGGAAVASIGFVGEEIDFAEEPMRDQIS